MAEMELTKAPTKSERLYAAWRVARADYDRASYAPENLADGPPEEVAMALCGSEREALIAYMLHPAESLPELARKLQTLRDEDMGDLIRYREIIGTLAGDAEGLTFA